MNFSCKTILITGASSGIGLSIAECLSQYDCKLILIARRIEKLEEIKVKLRNNKAEISAYKCDVSNKNEVQNTFGCVISKYSFIDIAIMNSGVGKRIKPENFNSNDADEIYGVNMFGIIYWMELLLPEFISKNKGMIVGVSSLADRRGYSGSGFYCSSKAAVSILLEGLRVELSSYNIKILTVRPGFVKTPMTDVNEFKMPFMISPEKAAKKIIEGIKKEKNIIEFPWQIVFLTKLIELLPNRFYEFLARKQYESIRK